MAEGLQLVLCSPLCFLVKKYCQTQVKMLKSALLDFYDGDTLSKAKQQLLTDFSSITEQVGIDSVPHIPQRRDGDSRAQREVDDMLTMLNVLDERLLLHKLPVYVSDGPDKMPAMRLYEGDFSVMMGILEKLNGKLTTFGSVLSAISRDVEALKSKSTVLARAGQPADQPRVVNNETLNETLTRPESSVLNLDTLSSQQAWPVLPVRGIETVVQPLMTSIGNSSGHQPSSSATETTSTCDVRNNLSGVKSASCPDKQWSVLASTPQGNNRFAALASTDDEVNEDRPFTTVRSLRAVRASAKRHRQQSAQAQQAERQSSQPALGRLKSRVVTGQSSAVSSSLWAAKKTIKKAVLCVDNVNLACNENDISAYVSSLGAEVFTCYQTKPRRRPNESAEDVMDRRAFRLCVNAADRDRLLNPDVWPDSLRISDWFFSNKNTQESNGNDGKRQRIDRSDELGAVESLRCSADNGSNNTARVDDPSGNIGTANVAREAATTAAVTAVANVEAMVTDAASGDLHEEDDDDDGDGDRTTIYQHGVC